MKWVVALGAIRLLGCDGASSTINEDQANSAVASVTAPEGLSAGSNEMLRAPITAAPELEVLISDVIIPADTEVPRHYHPGEEFVYVIEGSAIHVEEGKEDRLIETGDAMVIPPEAVHSPRGGLGGARAIVFRVHIKDQPERIPVPQE